MKNQKKLNANIFWELPMPIVKVAIHLLVNDDPVVSSSFHAGDVPLFGNISNHGYSG
jgi:hypothetical protein